MCNYREENKCKITKGVCPWVYYCNKLNAWKPLPKAPEKCKVLDLAEIPAGYSKVEFERHGYLYIKMSSGETIKLKNIFNNIPLFVKLYKSNGEWKIKKEKAKE